MFLDKDELATLTGFKHKAKQCDQLRRQGVAFRVNARGEPIVCRTALEGTTERKQKPDKQKWQSALSA
jgi:hypothetical protein